MNTDGILERAGEKGSNNKQAAAAKNLAILKYEILLNRDSVNYSEVRHRVFKGANEQIGKALGEISKEEYIKLDLAALKKLHR
jgi:hypothetical protein